MNYIIDLLNAIYNIAVRITVPFIGIPLITVFFIRPLAIIIKMIIKFASKKEEEEE